MAPSSDSLTEIIANSPVPAPKGHYSHAVWSGDLLWVSGIVGSDTPGLDAGEQTRVALGILREIVTQAGLSLANVVTTTAYTTAPGVWDAVNDAYREVFGTHRPARAIIPGAVFDGDCAVEILAVASR